MLDPEKVGGFKIHVARDSRKLFDAVDGQKAKEGGGGKLNTRRIIQSAFMDSIESGNKRGGKRKDSKGKKNDVQSF